MDTVNFRKTAGPLRLDRVPEFDMIFYVGD
jgi:hypothetical protein